MMLTPVSFVVLLAASGHLVSCITGHTAFVQISETSLVASTGCKLPTEITASVTFGDSRLPLKLELNQDIHGAPMFTQSLRDNRQVVTEQVLDSQDSGEYQDLSHGAAMTVTCRRTSGTNSNLELHGFLSYNGKEYILEKSQRVRRDTSSNRNGDEYDMVEEVKTPTINDYRIPSPLEDPRQARKENLHFSPLETASPTRHKRQTSQYYIDVLALIDNAIYKRWYDRSTQTVSSLKKQDALQNIRRYFAYVMNGVSLRYKSITGLNSVLNVRLVGYYVAETPAMGSWTETYKVSGTVRPEVDADKVLVYLRDWIPNRSLPEHDHAMLFTGYDLFTVNEVTRIKSTATSGLAYIRTLCRHDGRSISLVEDFGAFQCVDTAAHELGHSIGAKHDGDGNNCKATDRFIMSGGTYKSTPDNTQNPWFFSTCSVEYFRSYLSTLSMSSQGIQCLTGPLTQDNVPDVSGTLPGQLYAPDQQCKMIHGDSSRLCQGPEFGNSSLVCTNMFCLDPNSEGTCFQHDAARGTSCGDKKWCIDGICQYSQDAPNAVEGCVFGDQAGISFDGKNCADFTSGENSAYCYQQVVQGRCCASCRQYYTGVAGCLYGNKVRGCDAKFCDYVYSDGTRYDENCCQTCGDFTTAAPTTTTRLVITTTRPVVTTTQATVTTTRSTGTCSSNLGDSIGVTFNGMTCSEYVESDPGVCYSDSTLRYCCYSCQQKETGIQGCSYGDRFQGCVRDACDYIFEDGTTYKSYCCDTCNRTTDPTTSPTQTTTTPTTTTTTTPTTTTTTPTTTTTTPTTTTTTPTTTTTTPTTTTTTPTTTTPTTTPTTTSKSTTTTLVTTNPDNCVEDGLIYGVRCSSYLRMYGKGRCYNSTVSKACCRSCASVADNSRPDCMYGDRTSVCYNFLCDYLLEDGTPYSHVCCETCTNPPTTSQPSTTQLKTTTTAQPTTTPKSTTTTATTTTLKSTTTTSTQRTTSLKSTTTSTTTQPTTTTTQIMSTTSATSSSAAPTTTTTCVDTDANCSIALKSQGIGRCYASAFANTCCETCNRNRDVSLKGCEFGDKNPSVCNSLPRPLSESCVGMAEPCCHTCRDIVTAAAPTPRISFVPALLSCFVIIFTVTRL